MNLELKKLKSIKDQVIIPKPDKVSSMYRIHKYWARKPWYIVKEYINTFTKKDDVVLDPFCGSGVTGIESLILNRSSILVDLNSVATFITEMTAVNHRIDKDISRCFDEISLKLKDKINKLYELDEKCEECKHNLVGIYFERGPKFVERQAYVNCPNCNTKKNIKLTNDDIKKIKDIEKKEKALWYPKDLFPEKFDKNRITYKGITSVDKLYTNRNLIALSWVLDEIKKIKNRKVRNVLLLSFSDTVLHCSKLKAKNVRPMSVNNYWVPDDWIEENVWMRFSQRVLNLIKGKKLANKRIGDSSSKMCVYNRSSTDLNDIVKNNSVDFIFTDPPYGDSIQYQELSMIWNFWLKNKINFDEEIVINRTRKKNVDVYENSLTKVFKECYRVLKDDKYMVVTFHNKEFKVWLAILKSIQASGFSFIGLNSHDPLGNSYNKNWAKKSPKTDLYMLFKKIPNKCKQLNIMKNEIDLEKIIKDSISELKNVNLSSIYDKVLETCINYVFNCEDFESLKNLDINLIDKLSVYYGKEN